MFPYRVKYTESEYDIQNNGLLYKTHQQYQNTFDILKKWWDSKNIKKSNCYVVIYILSIIHVLKIWYFGNFVYFI